MWDDMWEYALTARRCRATRPLFPGARNQPGNPTGLWLGDWIFKLRCFAWSARADQFKAEENGVVKDECWKGMLPCLPPGSEVTLPFSRTLVLPPGVVHSNWPGREGLWGYTTGVLPLIQKAYITSLRVLLIKVSFKVQFTNPVYWT